MLLAGKYELFSHPHKAISEKIPPLPRELMFKVNPLASLGSPIVHRAAWDFGDYHVSVITGFGTFGGEKGLFEVAIFYRHKMLHPPVGHMEEWQVEACLQATRKKAEEEKRPSIEIDGPREND